MWFDNNVITNPKLINRCVKLFVGVILLTLLGGCYLKNPRYPEDWPMLVQSDDIENDIEGLFSCHGSFTDERLEANQFNEWPIPALMPGKKPRIWCTQLLIERITNGIEIRYLTNYYRHDGRQIYIKNIDYTTDKGWIIFNSVDHTTGESLKEWTHAQMTLNSKNELVIKSKHISAGAIIFPIPAVESTTIWGKYERIPDTWGKLERIPDTNKLDQLKLDAERGNTESQLALFKNIGEQKPEEALAWLCKSAEAGNREARFVLGNIFENGGYIWIKEGVVETVERNYKLAYVWYAFSNQFDQGEMQNFAERWQLDAEKTLEEWQPGNCEIDLGLLKNS